MTYAFDTLGYAKRLREVGVAAEQAEAHAEAARDFIMAELVTKSDLLATATSLRQEMDARFQQLQTAIERQTVRLGGMVAAAVVILAAIIKL